MVKGISRQVILVQSPDPKLFDQAIFILKENAIGREGVTDEALLREANQILLEDRRKGLGNRATGPLWACGGALVTLAVWLITTIF